MKRWTQFLLCLLLSASVWLIHNLSLKYTGVVTVSVLAKSSLKGRAQVASAPVTVNARCYATGFRLINLRRSDSDVLVEISPDDFEYRMSDDKYTVTAAALSKYAQGIFGAGVSLEAFLDPGYGFSFLRETNRTVPVKPVVSASFKPQYMAAEPMRIQPDSVVIYGNADILKNVDAVLTRPISINDASKNVSGVARIVPVPGIRISETEVAWAVDVVRYVEQRSQVHISVRGVPAGVKLSVLPSTAEAVFYCRFPARGNPAQMCEFYVDYAEFSSSVSGSCVVRCDNLPQGVIDWSIDPQVVDCLEMEEMTE